LFLHISDLISTPAMNRTKAVFGFLGEAVHDPNARRHGPGSVLVSYSEPKAIVAQHNDRSSKRMFCGCGSDDVDEQPLKVRESPAVSHRPDTKYVTRARRTDN
jgi:hypothetical protein